MLKNTMRTINKTFFHRNNVGNGTHLFKLKKEHTPAIHLKYSHGEHISFLK